MITQGSIEKIEECMKTADILRRIGLFTVIPILLIFLSMIYLNKPELLLAILLFLPLQFLISKRIDNLMFISR